MGEINYTLPVLALRGLTVLPDMILHFDVNRPSSIAALEAAMLAEQNVLLVTQLDSNVENPQREDLYTIGTVARVKQMAKMPKNRPIRVLVEGKFRAHIDDLVKEKPYMEAEVTIFYKTISTALICLRKKPWCVIFTKKLRPSIPKAVSAKIC